MTMLCAVGHSFAAENTNTFEPRNADGYSLDLFLLDAQFSSQALDALSQRGFHITSARLQRYHDAQAELFESVQRQSTGRVQQEITDWVEQDSKVRQDERSEFLKLCLKYAEDIAKDIAGSEFDEEKGKGQGGVGRAWLDNELAELNSKLRETNSTAAMTRAIRDFAKTHRQNVAGTRFEDAARRLYRGVLKSDDDLIIGIAKLQKRRLEVTANLVQLDRFSRAIQTADRLRDLPGELKSQSQAAITEQLIDLFPDVPADEVKLVAVKTFEVLQAAYDEFQSIPSFREDPELTAFPSVRRTAMRSYFLSKVMSYSLSGLKLAAGNALDATPVGSVMSLLEYYAEALQLTGKVGRRVSSLLTKFEQDMIGPRGGWIVVHDAVSFNLIKSPLMQKFGLAIASNPSETEFFYLNEVDEQEPLNSKFIRLNRKQYLRLESAIADERIAFASTEASSMIYDGSWLDFLTGARDGTDSTAVSDYASESYKKRLSAAALKTALSEAAIADIIAGRDFDHRGRRWTVDKLATRADTKIGAMATEMAIRRSIGHYDLDAGEKWSAFRERVHGSGLDLSTKQLLNLFNAYYHAKEPNTFDSFLSRLADKKTIHAKGVARVGIPMVHDSAVAISNELTLKSTVMVSGLAKGQTAVAEVQYVTPSGKTDTRTVELRNGANLLEQPLTTAETLDEKPEVELTLTADVAAPIESLPSIRAVGRDRLISRRLTLSEVIQLIWRDVLTEPVAEGRLTVGGKSGDEDSLIIKASYRAGPTTSQVRVLQKSTLRKAPKQETGPQSKTINHPRQLILVAFRVVDHKTSKRCRDAHDKLVAARADRENQATLFPPDQHTADLPMTPRFSNASGPRDLGHGSGIWTVVGIQADPFSERVNCELFFGPYQVAATVYGFDESPSQRRGIPRIPKDGDPKILWTTEQAKQWCENFLAKAHANLLNPRFD